MVRSRYAPSPTGMMHVGNLRAALFEYLIAKSAGGTFLLRIEDTDQARFVEGSMDAILDALSITGLVFDEGPGIGGDYGPYVQSERKDSYLRFARELVGKGAAYYCFCAKDEAADEGLGKYDRRCMRLSSSDVEARLAAGEAFVVRQLIPEGRTTFVDEVYGEITIDNEEIEDQILIKSDGMPTYNFANVIDDHCMAITHVVRGSEYLTSTPKYKLLYESFGWDVPVYVHLPLILSEDGGKMSKRRKEASFTSLLEMGYLPEAIINFIALLGWSPADNREYFSLPELVEVFDIKGISKSPSLFDMKKLAWMNGEHIKRLPEEVFYEMCLPTLQAAIKTPGIDLREVARLLQTRVLFVQDSVELVDFIDNLPDYPASLFTHKKMKTDEEVALAALQAILPVYEVVDAWDNPSLYAAAVDCGKALNMKNSQILWPIRTALSGKPSSPCGASELCALLGRDKSLRRLKIGIDKLQK